MREGEMEKVEAEREGGRERKMGRERECPR